MRAKLKNISKNNERRIRGNKPVKGAAGRDFMQLLWVRFPKKQRE